jgi:hypothetical protein
MLKQLFLFYLVAVGLVLCGEEEEGEGEGEGIDFSPSGPCIFQGSWYFEGKSHDTAKDTAHAGYGSVSVFEHKNQCYMNLQITTLYTSACSQSVMTLPDANDMYFDAFDQDIYARIYLTGYDRIGVQIGYNCEDSVYYGVSVPGAEPSGLLEMCAESSYFYCSGDPAQQP